MLEYEINDIQLKYLNRQLELYGRNLIKVATKAFKASAKNFVKNVISTIKKNNGITDKKLKQRIRQYVLSDLKIKIFAGFYRTGITNWKARQTKQGVTYGKPVRKLRKSAFLATMPEGGKLAVKRTGEYKIASKGRYKGKKREILQKQVTENNEIENIIEPILKAETKHFYTVFNKIFDKEVNKFLKQQLRK